MSGLGRVQRIAARQRAYTGPNPCNRCAEPQAPGSIFCVVHKQEFEARAERVKFHGESIDELAKFCERIYWGPVKGKPRPLKLTTAQREALDYYFGRRPAAYPSERTNAALQRRGLIEPTPLVWPPFRLTDAGRAAIVAAEGK